MFTWLDNLITRLTLQENASGSNLVKQQKLVDQATPKAGLRPEKCMLSIRWSLHGVLYWELLPEIAKITGTMYRIQPNKLAPEIKSKGLLRGKIYFQHDNARPHVAKVVNAKLQELGWKLLPHPPYSPDLAPSDYHLFRSLSNDLRDRKFKEERDLKM